MRRVISDKPQLEQIKMFLTVVADTGSVETLRKFVAGIVKLEKFVVRKIS